MSNRSDSATIHSVGIDLGKTTFHLVALGDNGKVLLKKKFTQRQLIIFTANLQAVLIGLEACSGAAFHKGREFAAWMRLVPKQYSTRGKAKLYGISKRGNRYLRRSSFMEHAPWSYAASETEFPWGHG
ncbi:transposase [Tunturiibacter gelidiferens]